MWKRRFWETFAIITIGDGVIEVLAPREHSLLWRVGPGKGVARFFAENPNYMRLLGLSQIAFGVWLATRQYRKD
ncbi:MAG: hypothetical protein M3494_01125 [Actinomycetota bacterium]|jgi:hypothetical protein|nr:hypothetical protein [Rubrobacter sp.]MDQ3506611.1 hypothetical protein [Actinomycetota bacterium]